MNMTPAQYSAYLAGKRKNRNRQRPNTAGPARWDAETRTLYVPVYTKSEGNVREHHMAVHARKHAQRKAIYNAMAALVPVTEFVHPCPVHLVRVAPGRLDPHDNLPAAFKAVVDEIAKRFNVPDNHPDCRWTYDQRRGDTGEYAVEITFRERTTK